MDISDLVYPLFLLICLWLALYWDGSSGGGRRSRIPAGIPA